MADRGVTDDEMVLAFVRGRLPADEAERLGAEAAIRPEPAAEIALARGIVGLADEDARRPAPGALGWARLNRAIDAEPAAAAEPAEPGRTPWWQLGAAAAAAVVVWQLAAVPFLTRPAPVYQPVTEAPAAVASLAVAFGPAATEPAMRELVRSVGGRVTDGPSAVGLWTVSFADAGARDNGMALLMASPIVESVQVR